MSIGTFPAASSGGAAIKSVQRGVATSAGTVTISAVNISKSFVNSFSNAGGGIAYPGSFQNLGSGIAATTISAGSDWTSKSYGGYLTGSTSLVVTGACYWEVIEYN